jgi:RNA-directed DNA polymerase
MARLADLKATTNLRDVAQLLGFQPKAVSYILYVKPQASRYSSFSMAKRKGGTRIINAPAPDLKLLQRRLADLLQDCAHEINVAHGRGDRLAHGFKRKRSIICNATGHRRRKWVFNVDLEDFFGTINFGRVRGFFMHDRDFALPASVATVLAQIACHDNRLPQGSPCSPVVSNLVTHILDIHLCKLASKYGCTYSRYADDLTFSTNKPKFPEGIALRTEGQPHKWEIGNEVQEIIEHSQFRVNDQKTRMQYRNSRQEVTGLVVNAKVNIRSEYRRIIRVMAHNLFLHGKFTVMKLAPNGSGALVFQSQPGKMDQLHGMFGHVHRVDLYNTGLAPQPKCHSPEASKPIGCKEQLYKRFLMYKLFYATPMPLVICEGKTDNVYLKHAMKRLAAQFPELTSIFPQNKVSLKVRTFKYSDTSTGTILKLNGGAGDLQNFIPAYRDELKKFVASGTPNPVIILVDNDEAGRRVLAVAKSISKQQVDQTVPFLHIFCNLYLILTPIAPANQQSEIENCFSAAFLQLTLNGKTFHSGGKGFDKATNFGKVPLAGYVEKNASTIDFSGFEELLNRMTAVIQDYRARFGAPQSPAPAAPAAPAVGP